jgi:hypothetical protein
MRADRTMPPVSKLAAKNLFNMGFTATGKQNQKNSHQGKYFFTDSSFYAI